MRFQYDILMNWQNVAPNNNVTGNQQIGGGDQAKYRTLAIVSRPLLFKTAALNAKGEITDPIMQRLPSTFNGKQLYS